MQTNPKDSLSLRGILTKEKILRPKKKLSWGNVRVRQIGSRDEWDQDLQNYSSSFDEEENGPETVTPIPETRRSVSKSPGQKKPVARKSDEKEKSKQKEKEIVKPPVLDDDEEEEEAKARVEMPAIDNSFYFSDESFACFLRKSRESELASDAETPPDHSEPLPTTPEKLPKSPEQTSGEGLFDLATFLETAQPSSPPGTKTQPLPAATVPTTSTGSRRRLSDFVEAVLRGHSSPGGSPRSGGKADWGTPLTGGPPSRRVNSSSAVQQTPPKATTDSASRIKSTRPQLLSGGKGGLYSIIKGDREFSGVKMETPRELREPREVGPGVTEQLTMLQKAAEAMVSGTGSGMSGVSGGPSRFESEEAGPSLRTLLGLKVYQCMIASAQLARLDGIKGRLATLGRCGQAGSRRPSGWTATRGVEARLLSRVFGVRVTSALGSLHGDETLFTFLFREELVVIARAARGSRRVACMLLYLTDGGRLGRLLPSRTQRAGLTDFLLRKFRGSSAAKDAPDLFDCLASVCGDYEAVALMLQRLAAMKSNSTIKEFELRKDGDISVVFSPRIFHYIQISFSLKLGESGWNFKLESSRLETKVLVLTRKTVEEAKIKIIDLIGESVKGSVLSAAQRLEESFKLSNQVGVTCFLDGILNEDKTLRPSNDDKNSQ